MAKGVETTTVNVALKKVEDSPQKGLAEPVGLAIGSSTCYSNISW
jgi:hypothetical protein